jgi:excisionase family DNA binding protein
MSQTTIGISGPERKALSGAGRQFGPSQRGPPEADAAPWAYTINEVATKLRVSSSSIRRAISRGELEAVKFGGLTRVLAPEALRYAAAAPRAKFCSKAA